MLNKIMLLAVVAVSLMSSRVAWAGEEVESLHQGVPHERLFAIDSNGEQVVAVGDLGTVLMSTDGGASWAVESVPTDLALLGVAIFGQRVVAVGQQGIVLLRNRSGNWTVVETPTKERLLNVDANSNGVAYAVGAFGTVLVSTDYGESWTASAPNWLELADEQGDNLTGAAGEPTMYAVQVFDDASVLIGGEIGYILHANSPGQNWYLVNRDSGQSQGVAATINGIHVDRNGHGFAVGQSGLVLKTRNSGLNWTPETTGFDGNLLDVATTENGKIAAVGMRIGIHSTDNGASWHSFEDDDISLNWYSDITFSPKTNRLIAVGHSARIVSIGL